jgi:hypothetical protein
MDTWRWRVRAEGSHVRWKMKDDTNNIFLLDWSKVDGGVI